MSFPAQSVRVTFYKASGKWYGEASAAVRHYLFEEEAFKQDIVDTQSGLIDGWQNNGFFVTVENTSDDDHFAHHLFGPEAFAGIVKSTSQQETPAPSPFDMPEPVGDVHVVDVDLGTLPWLDMDDYPF